ncbi:hypothetical protein NJ75_04677 [Novosphingobium subterraneum]|jgi:hypothetical protein|uniref:Uncharacterized protein n=1 Tax=Novosphingobium subterraneum TaxID=48936 RepID=A0A0B8ZTH4_9SPHN|nr:hypothetical protein NJ75_04677 [Novosphingobium subterraneum]
MIRHGPSCMTGTLMAHWPMTQPVPISELKRVHCTVTRTKATDHGLMLLEITLSRPASTLPKRKRLPSRTIPKSLYT